MEFLTPTQTGCYRSKTIAQTDEAIYWPRQWITPLEIIERVPPRSRKNKRQMVY
jgi:hypothetical protein